MNKLPPSEPIPRGFDASDPPWMWKVTYGVVGAAVASICMAATIVFSIDYQEKANLRSACWDPPAEARRWADPEVVSNGTDAPLVCAERVNNNDGVMPHSHRCVRMVPCE